MESIIKPGDRKLARSVRGINN